MTLDVAQTSPDLKNAEGAKNEYTGANFYLEQFIDCLRQLKNITYIVADGFYTKEKVFRTITFYKKPLITKLKCEANLRYLYTGKQNGGRGANRMYAGKVQYDDLGKWNFEGIDYSHSHLHI